MKNNMRRTVALLLTVVMCLGIYSIQGWSMPAMYEDGDTAVTGEVETETFSPDTQEDPSEDLETDESALEQQEEEDPLQDLQLDEEPTDFVIEDQPEDASSNKSPTEAPVPPAEQESESASESPIEQDTPPTQEKEEPLNDPELDDEPTELVIDVQPEDESSDENPAAFASEEAAEEISEESNASEAMMGTAEAAICGEQLSWVLREDGVLTVSGTGAMYDYATSDQQPWREQADQIREVKVGSGITCIGSCAFSECENLASVTIANSVTEIHQKAFAGCVSLQSVILPKNCNYLGDSAFLDCTNLEEIIVPDSLSSIGKAAFKNCTSLNHMYTSSEALIDISGASLTILSKPYTGQGQRADVSVVLGDTKLQEGTDYTVTNCTGTDAGDITVTVSGQGNYTGILTGTFTITRADISKAKVTITKKVYNGSAQTPEVRVVLNNRELHKGTDYTIDKAVYKNANTYQVGVTGIGNYIGTAVGSFTIVKAAQTVTVTAPASVIKGKTVAVTTKGVGNVSYSSGNTKIATVTSKGVVKGIAPGTVTITAKASGNANYNAASKTVKIIVKLPTPTISKLENVNSGVKITVGKVTGAAKYRIFYKIGKGKWTKLADITSNTYTWKKAKSGTTYTFNARCISKDGKIYTSDYNKIEKSLTYVATPTLSSVKNTKAKTATAAWKKLTGVTGYQIQYSTSKTLASGNKTITVKGANSASKAIGSMTKGKTYYFRIRSYKTVSRKNVYSAWSTVKSIKIAK